jgi:hypothetical protein
MLYTVNNSKKLNRTSSLASVTAILGYLVGNSEPVATGKYS